MLTSRRIHVSILAGLLLHLAGFSLSAQPRIAYIIPDIGAENMNTAVEIVAEVGATGTFGTDNIYTNNPGDAVRVVATGPRAGDVVVGPLVVSWNGRVISTQVFVRPNAAPGTVQLQVTSSAGTATVPFEIVTPIASVNAGGSGALGSGGAFGTRSKRGAMIVDQLILGSGNTYTVSTADTDGGTSGNQGYLPLIIIAREVVSFGASTVDASGSGVNGGAGGGGGGGQMCDRTFLGNGGSGTNGGDGYSGGGAGGQNNSGGSSSFRSVGVGTGGSGMSLSDVAAGSSSSCYEGAGGGTGHPFGRSGFGWCGSGAVAGQYGGASTGGQNGGGGGGGFANDGTNGSGSETSNNRGRAVGNDHLVPLAGGSGGASGNPQAISGGCGGEGGGGGGAIAIYSMNYFVSQTTFRVRGADGTNGRSTTADGGGGSGGSIILGVKAIAGPANLLGAHQLEGGDGPGRGGDGSTGRFRHDGFLTAPAIVTPGASTYIGPSTDTLTVAEGFDFTIRGTRSATQNIRVYMKSGAGGTWQQLPNPVYTGREWSIDVTASSVGLHYIAAFQQGGILDGEFTDEPVWVTSQVAANIVEVTSVPRIEVIGSPSGSLGNPGNCLDQSSSLVMRFMSTGTEDLNVRTEIVNESTPGVFRVSAPAGIDGAGGLNYPPDPNDTTEIRVTATVPPGNHTAELRVITNDPRGAFDTIFIPLQVQRPGADVDLLRDTIDFGKLCLTQEKLDTTFLRFRGDAVAFNVSNAPPKVSPPFYRIRPADGTTIFFSNPTRDPAYDSTVAVEVRFRPLQVGTYLDSIIFKDECDSLVILYLKGEGVEAKLELSSPALNVGPVLLGNSGQGSIWIRNTGQSPVVLGADVLTPPPGPFRLISPNPIAGNTIPEGDSIEIVVEFTPDSIGLFQGDLDIEVEGPCAKVPTIPLRGQGVDICLQASVDSLNFIADSCEANPQPLDSLLIIRNCGGVAIELLEAYSVNGTLTNDLEATLPKTLTIMNQTTRAAQMRVSWDPQNGTGTDSVAVVWRDVAEGRIDTLYIPVRTQFDQAIVQLQTTSGDTIPSVVDIGGVYQCGAAQDTIVLVNAGTIEGEITASFVKGGIFDVSPSIASPYLLAVGGSQDIIITLDPANAPVVGQTYEDTLVLVNGRCNQEWRVALRSTRHQLEMRALSANFGATNLNLPRTQTVTFRNTTIAPPDEELTIERVYIDPPGASPPFAIDAVPTLPAQVQASGGTFDVDLSFTPTVEQKYTGRLCFEISEPCDTVICVDLNGEGIRSNIYVPQGDLTFGETYYCAEDTLGLTIFSVGPVPLSIDSIRVIGPDRAGFEILSLSKTPQVTLLPGFPSVVDSIDVQVRFIPANVPPDGVKSAILEIYSDDSAQGLVQVPLTGERTSPQIFGPGLVDYGTVVVGGSALQRLTLTNTSDDPITLASPSLGSPFRIVTPLPLTIPAKGSLEVDVEFAPTDSEVYNDTLVGLFALPCDGELRVALTGEGLRGETLISIPSTLTGDPGDRIAIPIILEEATALADVGATTVRVWIRFNKTMMLPVDADGTTGAARSNGANASSGSIISNEIDGDDRVVGLEFANDPLPTAPGTLGLLDVVVLLGDELTTGITFDSIRWVDGEVATDSRDGEFMLTGYCDVGSDRLVRLEGEFGIKSVTPNPIGSRAEVIFETVENGPTRVEMFDLSGRKVATLVDVPDLPVQAHLAAIPTGELATGAYTIVLTTPTQRSVRHVVIRR